MTCIPKALSHDANEKERLASARSIASGSGLLVGLEPPLEESLVNFPITLKNRPMTPFETDNNSETENAKFSSPHVSEIIEEIKP